MNEEDKKIIKELEKRIEFSKKLHLQACGRMNWHPKQEKSLDMKLLELINKLNSKIEYFEKRS